MLGRNGFHGTGLNELIAASGAPRGSLYYHFPGGKAEIVAAGLEIARAQTDTLLRHAFAGERPLKEKVLALFASSMNEDLPSYGCPVAAVALDNQVEDGQDVSAIAANDPMVRSGGARYEVFPMRHLKARG